MRMDKGNKFMHIEADTMDAPTFSERFLYETVGKGEARFILGVAEEYEHVIDALGPKAVRAILDVKPRLVQRLATGEMVVEHLADAVSDGFERREERAPSEVKLDHHEAHAAWQMLHDEYRRYFEPEESMDADLLRAYHALTDALGEWEQRQRQQEIDRLPEKVARRDEQVRRRDEQKRAKHEQAAAVDAVVAALESGEGRDGALARYAEVFGKAAKA